MRVVVLSDTHARRRWKACPPRVRTCSLATYAPVHAVLGNNDVREVAARGAPETLELDLGGVGRSSAVLRACSTSPQRSSSAMPGEASGSPRLRPPDKPPAGGCSRSPPAGLP